MTEKMERCRDCIYLVEGVKGEWICEDWGEEIHQVADEQCVVENSGDKE